MNAELVTNIQQLLAKQGFPVPINGVMDEISLRAIGAALAGQKPPPPPSPRRGGRSMAWGKLVEPDFREGVYWLCRELGWDEHRGASDLMSCMAWESNETFSPKVKNMAGSGATGLIQFMPKTAKELGTSVEELATMSRIRQLGFVYLYFKQFSKMRGPGITLADMYMAILMPSYIGQAMDTPIFTNGIAYRQNAGLDANRDGKVTKIEAAAKVYAKLERGNLPQFLWVE